jgi:hypothetical protein
MYVATAYALRKKDIRVVRIVVVQMEKYAAEFLGPVLILRT